MPRLSRVRFVSVGHPNARFEDVTLDLRGSDGLATDSVLWLRNGGGKSSLLNLLFAVIRTDRRDFLGGRADSRQRALEDYILPSDRGVVVTEWELDRSWDALDLGEKARFTVGVFYEHRQEQERALRRLFFAGRVIPGVPETSLEGLPLSELRDGQRVRRTLHGFREVWNGLAQESGDPLALTTETQREWYGALDRAGIDPDLFRYQLRMNLREGGADELFRFASDEDFVDFLLELTVDPSHSEDVGKNIEAFRDQLRRRQQEYLPELEFCQGLHQRLLPFGQLRREREALGGRGAELGGELAGLLGALDALERQRAEALQETEKKLTKLEAQLEERARKEQTLERLQHGWRYKAATLQCDELTEKLREVEAQDATLRREVALLSALQHELLRRRWEAEGAAYAKERAMRHEALRPDKERADIAAAQLAVALDRSLQARRAEEQEASAARQEARDALDALRTQEIEASTNMRMDAARAEQRRQDIDALRAQLQKLVRDGVIEHVDQAAEALLALNELRESSAEQAIERQEQVAAAREAADLAVHRQAEELATQHGLQQRLARCAEELQQAEARWERFVQNPELLRRLEAESLTRDELSGHHALDLFERASAVLRQRALSARSRRAELERDDEALRQTGFLAPEVDVELVLAKLPAEARARSGWQEIASRVGSLEEAQKMIAAAPELARGVIVDDGQLTLAIAHLKDLALEFPVVVAEAASWEAKEASSRTVLKGSNAARFDRTAAQKAHAQLEERAAALEAQAQQADEALRSLALLIDELRTLRARFGSSWFEEQLRAQHEMEKELEESQERSQRWMTELQSARQQEAQSREALETIERQLRDLARQGAHLEALGDAPVRLAQLEKEQQQSASNVETYRATLEEIAGQRLREELRADELEATRDRLRDACRRMEDERQELGVISKERLQAVADETAGDLETLRSAWRAARAIFEDAAGDDGLAQMERHAVEQANKEAQRAQRALADLLHMEEVHARAETLDDPERVEDLLRSARERWTQVSVRKGEAESLVRRATEELAQAEKRYEEAHRPVVEDVTDAGTARRRALAISADLENLRDSKGPLDEAVLASKGERLRLQHQRDPLSQLRLRCQQLAEMAGVDAEPVEGLLLSYEQLQERADAVARALQGMDQDRAALTKRRQEAVRAVRAWCLDARFESLRGEVAQRFRRMEDGQLEADAESFAEQLRVRAEQLEASVRELDQHRRTLAQLILQLAVEGIRQLELAGTVSKMPAHVPEFGGERFLEIRMQVPQDPAWRAESIGQLLDEVVTRPEIPSGIELVQLAVRRLAGALRVRVLNPNPASLQRRISVTETAKFSGGEQLTSAILLFCTLANVRARNRGLAPQPSSVLILDNPIGRASRRRFIEMQLEFARAMNVQLIYTTAVNDAEALSVMPNLIRLTNQRIDARRGHRLVEAPGATIVGKIETKRLTKNEARSASEGDAAAATSADDGE